MTPVNDDDLRNQRNENLIVTSSNTNYFEGKNPTSDNKIYARHANELHDVQLCESIPPSAIQFTFTQTT